MSADRKPTIFSSNASALAEVGTRLITHGLDSVQCTAPSLKVESDDSLTVVPIVGTWRLRDLDRVPLTISVTNEAALTTMRLSVADTDTAIGIPYFDKEASMSVPELRSAIGKPVGFTALHGVVEVDPSRILNTFELFGELPGSERELVNVTAEFGPDAQNLAADGLVYVIAVAAGRKLPSL